MTRRRMNPDSAPGLCKHLPMADLRRLPYPAPDLNDGVVVLRRWSYSDLGCVEEASSERAIPEATTVPRSFTPAAGRAFVERQWSRHDNDEGVSLAIADADTNVARGMIVMVFQQQPASVNIGYWVVPSGRGRHLATRAVGLLSRWAVLSVDIGRVQAWIEPGNAASHRVITSAGFQREGLLRSFLAFETRRADAVVYSLLPSDVASVGVVPAAASRSRSSEQEFMQ